MYVCVCAYVCMYVRMYALQYVRSCVSKCSHVLSCLFSVVFQDMEKSCTSASVKRELFSREGQSGMYVG